MNLSQSSLIFDRFESACKHNGYRYLTHVWESTQYCLPVEEAWQIALSRANSELYLKFWTSSNIIVQCMSQETIATNIEYKQYYTY